MRHERTEVEYAGASVGELVFGRSGRVRRGGGGGGGGGGGRGGGLPGKGLGCWGLGVVWGAGGGDGGGGMFGPVMGRAFWTLAVVWVVEGEGVGPGSGGGAWVGLAIGWLVASVAAGIHAVRVSRAVRVIEVGAGRVVLREMG